ncbi:hypothetical protein Tco_0466501 [Tanacetum coccineum]
MNQTPRQLKRGRDTKIPQSSGLPKKVGDEAVHKELGDRMERAATTASSLEAEQDNDSGPSTSENGEMEITTTIDEKVKTVTEESIRRHFKLEDSDGISTLPNTEIFEQLALMGPKKTSWEQFSSNIATAIICLATNMTFNFSRMIFEGMVKNLNKEAATLPHNSPLLRVYSLGSDEGSMTLHELTVLCTTLSKKVECLESNLKQTKLTYGAAFTNLIMKGRSMIEDIDQVAGVSLDQINAEDQGSAAKILADVARVHTYSIRRMTISTGSGGISTAKESISTTGASMPVSTVGMD